METYWRGLNGPQVVWANRKYHGHQVLPNNIMETLEAAASGKLGIFLKALTALIALKHILRKISEIRSLFLLKISR